MDKSARHANGILFADKGVDNKPKTKDKTIKGIRYVKNHIIQLPSYSVRVVIKRDLYGNISNIRH